MSQCDPPFVPSSLPRPPSLLTILSTSMAPTTPSPQGKKTVSSASKDVKTAGSPKAARSEGGSPTARNGEGSNRAWTAEEDAVFYQAMIRTYKPNWP